MPFFLEVFSGKSAVSRALGRLGYYVVAIDIVFGQDHDATKLKL